MKATLSDQRAILDIQNFDFAHATLTNKAANLPEIVFSVVYAISLRVLLLYANLLQHMILLIIQILIGLVDSLLLSRHNLKLFP